jgi:hypothetical protein
MLLYVIMLDHRKLDRYARTLAIILGTVSRFGTVQRAEALALLGEVFLSADQAAAVISYALARDIVIAKGDRLRPGPVARRPVR